MCEKRSQPGETWQNPRPPGTPHNPTLVPVVPSASPSAASHGPQVQSPSQYRHTIHFSRPKPVHLYLSLTGPKPSHHVAFVTSSFCCCWYRQGALLTCMRDRMTTPSVLLLILRSAVSHCMYSKAPTTPSRFLDGTADFMLTSCRGKPLTLCIHPKIPLQTPSTPQGTPRSVSSHADAWS